MTRNRLVSNLSTLAAAVALTGCSAAERSAQAEEHQHHQAQPNPPTGAVDDQVLAAYLDIHRALAADSIEGVAAAAARLGQAAEAHRGHGGSHAALAVALIEAASGFDGLDLVNARQRFRALSQQMIRYRAMFSTVSDQTLVIHCSMANADWLQTSASVSNPFYGRSTASCGEVIKQRGEV